MPVPQHVSFTVANLPTTEYGHRAPLWWGVVLAVAIESTVVALTLSTLLYLRTQEATWPPWGWSAPDPLYGALSTVLILLSAWPMYRIDVEARRLEQRKVKRLLIAFFVVCIIALPVRALEFYGLQVKWDSNAYGSVVWATLSLHTLHLVSSIAETAIIAVYVFVRPLDEKHALDLNVSALYWYFVVAAWIPIYVALYAGPYLLN